jgi:septal ring factor EnvC (AmiA/AmiB activator)
MKTPLISSGLLLALAAGALADPDPAPFINKQIAELNKKVDADLTTGALTQADADELKREISHVQDIEQSEPSLTVRTRRDLRQQLSKIDQDLKRKEDQAKALASPSPTP